MTLVSKLKNRSVALWALLALGAASPAARAASVAYINSGGGSISYLTGFGHTVTDISNPISLTLGDLAGYDVVVAASNSTFSQATNIGNVLADFADAGGGVVLTEFTFQGIWALGGRIMTAGYSPFITDPLSGGYDFSGVLGTVYDAGSPLLAGAAAATTYYQADVGLDSSAVLVADWDSGRHAVAYNSLGSNSVVAVNLFPSQNHYPFGETGYQRLMSNAVQFSLTGGSGPRVPDSSPGVVALVSLAGLFIVRRRFGVK